MREPIVAAVMVQPRAPIELRDFAAPDLPSGASLLRTEYAESLRHRRAPVARPVVGRPLSHHSGARGDGNPRGGSRTGARPRRTAAARGRSRGVLRRAPDVRAVSCVRRRAHSDPLSVAAGLRHHRPGGGGAARRLGRSRLSRARRRDRTPARLGERRDLHRRRVWPADGRAHRRARGDSAGRPRPDPGCRSRWPQRRSRWRKSQGRPGSGQSASPMVGGSSRGRWARISSSRSPGRRLPTAGPRSFSRLAAGGPISWSKPPARLRPSRRDSTWCATAASMSSPGITLMRVTAASTRIGTSIASTSMCAAAGVAKYVTSCRPSSCWPLTSTACRGRRSAPRPSGSIS